VTTMFRSIISTAARHRARPPVERSTFVMAQHGPCRLAIPVECVLRVERAPTASDLVPFGGTMLPLHALATGEEATGDHTRHPHDRVLILRAHAAAPPHLAGLVHAVLDVVAVETVLVRPRSILEENVPAHPAVRGMFSRMDSPVWVIDPARFPRPA
jgi:hypothetical protein